MERFTHRIRLALALAIAIAAVTPAIALAAVRPAAVLPDAFEPDDTTATAKVNPTTSLRTVEDLTDYDYSFIDIEATGTPIIAENTWVDGWLNAMPLIFRYDPATGGIATVGTPSPPFAGPVVPGAMLAHAPTPGRYFVASFPAPLIGGAAGGRYSHFQAEAQMIRIAGPNRFATAAAVSRKMFPMADSGMVDFFAVSGAAEVLTPNSCIVATGRGFADALAAGAWAAKSSGGPLFGENYPILLTNRDSLAPETKQEILRLGRARSSTTETFTVYVLGDASAISEAVEDEIRALSVSTWTSCVTEVVRIGGRNRFETAAAIASESASSTMGIGDTVFIVNGFKYADALAAAPVAAHALAPILLVSGSSVPSATSEFLDAHPGITTAIVVGGASTVATDVIDTLEDRSMTVERVWGSDRYETAEALARYGANNYGMQPIGCVLVTGQNYPDGLAAAGLTATQHTPILLSPKATLAPAVEHFFADYPLIFASYLVGGEASVSSVTESEFNAIPMPSAH